MSKPDLTSLYKLEFYRKQDNWRLASKPRRRGKEKCTTSARGDFNKTYVLSESVANINTKLNNAFLETEPESPTEDNGQGEKTQNETQIMNSFNELCSNPDKPEKEQQAKLQKPESCGSLTPEYISKIDSCMSPNIPIELPNILLADLPLHTDLWSEKVDFDLNDCNNITPHLQSFENNAKTENENILVNLLKKHKFFTNQLNNKGASAEDNENPLRGFAQNNFQQNEQENFNKVDILTKLKQKMLPANLFNNNYLILNANHQPILENIDFDSHFHNVNKTIDNSKRSLSLHEKNFELANQEPRNFERNFVESTLPTTFRTDLEKNDNRSEIIGNKINEPNFKNNVKPFKNVNNDFQYVPTDSTENSQNCYINSNIMSPHNQYIINNYKPIFFNQEFKPFFGDNQAATKEYEAYLKNCQILSENYHPEAFTKNFQNDAKSFQIDANIMQMNPTFQNDSNNFHFAEHGSNIDNYNMLHHNSTHQIRTHQNPLVHQVPLPHKSPIHQNPSLHQNPTLPNQLPHNHQIFVHNPRIYRQIPCDPVVGAYPEFVKDHCDPCFEWTENFKEQVLDDIDGIWNEGQAALSNAAHWLNLAVDEENMNPDVEQICSQLEDLNMNTTSSTDSATFMRGAALVPHSSEISLSTASGGRERNKLASLVQHHATALKSLLSRANSYNSLSIQTPSSISQQKTHSATNTTPDQSCDYYPSREVGSNTPLVNPTNQIAIGEFDAKLDQLREKLAQDQVRLENCVAEQKLYTVFSKFQQYKECPSLEVGSQPEQQFRQNQVLQRNYELKQTDRKLHQGEHIFEITERKLHQVEHNFQSTENNQQIEHKLGHHNMRTVNRTEMGSFKQSSSNYGPYNRRKRSCNKNNFNYFSKKKIHQIDDFALDA